MFIYFLGGKLCKFSVLLAPNIMIGPTIDAIASGVILNPNILHENIPLISVIYMANFARYINHYCETECESSGKDAP